jgi:hypothetical protein
MTYCNDRRLLFAVNNPSWSWRSATAWLSTAARRNAMIGYGGTGQPHLARALAA